MNAPTRLTWVLRDPAGSATGLEEGFGDHADARCALEAWWEVRDLWLRLLQSMTLRIVDDGDGAGIGGGNGDGPRLEWRLEWRPRPGKTCIDAELWYACRDPNRYAWREDGRRGSLLTDIDTAGMSDAGGRLSMRLVPERALRHWAGGPTVLAELRVFLRSQSHGPASPEG